MQNISVVSEAYANIQEGRMTDFVPVFESTRVAHKDSGKTYVLSEEAEEEYSRLVDS